MSQLATLDEITARLDWDLDEKEREVAAGILDDASDLARFYGSTSWTDAATAPPIARMLVRSAVVRYMKNPDGYTQSRAGDETVAWTDKDREAGTIHFTEKEIKQLTAAAGKLHIGFGTVPIFAHNPRRHLCDEPGYVPADGGKPFPLYPDEDGPW